MVSHLPPNPAPTTTTRPKPATLRSGAEGAQVEALQRRLHELGYQVQEADGQFGGETHHSVVAFQKVRKFATSRLITPPIAAGSSRRMAEAPGSAGCAPTRIREGPGAAGCAPIGCWWRPGNRRSSRHAPG